MAKEFSLEEALGRGTKTPTEFSLEEALGTTAPEDGDSTIGSELVRGGKQVASSIRSGLGALIGSPEEAARAGVQRSEAIAQEAGEGVSLEAVKRAYQEKGLLSAAGEVIDQTPRAVASQAAQLALMAGGAKAGAMAGTAVAPGIGTIVGGALGAGATLLPQLLGSNVERQASEQMARDKEVDINLLAAGAGAVGQTALETAAPAFILGKRLVKGLLGITDDAALATAKAQQEMVDAANRSLLSATGRGTARGAAVEIPVEIASSVIERAQAGLDITSPEALAEYGEVAYQSALIGGPLGAASGAADTVLARQTVGEQPTEAVSDFEREREEFARSGTERPVTVVDDEIDPVDAIAAETPPEPPVELPGGFTVARREVARQEVPEAFGIFPEGSDKPLITVGTPQEVEQKLQSLTQIRKEEEKRLNEEFDKITSGLLAEERKIEVMEATGQAGTDQYVQATALLEQKKLQENEKLVDIRDRIQSYAAPLTFAPIGRRTEVQNEFVVNRGEEPVGVFPSFEAAQSTVEQLAPEAFKQAEQARVQARMQEIDSVLKPAFAKFNLGDVGLNIVEAIKTDTGGLADGAYARNLIQIAVDAPEPLQTMRHETVHALKELGFFTPQQWKALSERAEKEWINQYLGNEKADVNGVQMSRLDAYKEIAKERKLTPEQLREEIVEEAIADAFGAYSRGATPPPGMIAALFKKLQNFFLNFKQALRGAGFESADDIFQRIERGELKSRKAKAEAPSKAADKPEAKAPKEEAEKPEAPIKASVTAVKQADKYEEENGIRPYVPEGKSGFPTKPPKYSIQKYNPDKHLKFDPTLGVPINKDGTVTVYYHTTKQKSLQIGQSKVIPSDGRNRVYLSNESGGDAILRNKGNFDQEFDGSTVLVYVTPDMLQLDAEYENGRRDFFIPLQEGDFFNKKMKMQSIQKGREDAITDEFSYVDHEEKISRAVKAYKDASPAERRKLISQARKTLKKEHNVGSLLSENGKLEKTRIGEYGLDYEGNSVASQGLGLAAAQKITEKVSTCPRSAICEGLCLGETSGGNFMFGGTASEDVADIKKSAFRAGPRMMQYLKTEALIINPEAFATLLQAEIDSLKKWSAAPTQIKIDPETKKRLNVEKEIYQPAVRLNVTSDFKPEMFRGIIEGNPDVRFYDYTKLGGESLAENHHLTYSSTGFGQIIDGKKVFFKTKAGQYDHNWATMRKRLNNGQNVAMAFSSKSALPKTLLDEETQTEYRIWDGDDYDARFLDPKQPDGKGMIIGLRNKAGNLSEKNATEKTDGFFVKYDPKTDGDTVVVPDQLQFKEPARKIIPLKQEKFSLRAPTTPAFKKWFGDSKIVDADGNPLVVYHGTQSDFSEFDIEKSGASNRFGPGLYFTSDKRTFDTYGGREGGNVMPVFLSMKNPQTGSALTETQIKKFFSALQDKVFPNGYDATDDQKKFEQRALDNPSKAFDILLSAQTAYISQADWVRGMDAIGVDGIVREVFGYPEYVVFSPTQIKSATGNIGTYDPENTDIRYSLRTKASAELKQWAGDTTIVDGDGNPRAMYHGLAKDTADFTRKTERGAPIFLTDDPNVAAIYAAESYKSVARNPQKYLSKQQIDDGVKRAIAAIRKDYGKDTLGKEMIESLKTGNLNDANPEAKEYIQKEFISLLPAGPHIMKLYVRAENPFDYSNLRHIDRIKEFVELDANLLRLIREGDWDQIEQKEVQDAIKAAGFDSFYVKEHGRKNLAVYDPNQVKSATGNVGTYSRESNDVSYSLRGVRFPSVKAVKEAVAKTSVPETPEFKRFIAGNQWVDEDDKAAVFYHATSDDFLEFTPAGKTQAIYLSRTPEESEVFGRMAEERRREKIYELLNKDQKLELFQRVLGEQVKKGGITEEQVSEFIRDAKRRAPEYGKFGDFDKPIKDALLELSPARMSIMPLYARAETPFDFRNPDHVARVAAATRRPDAKISEVNRETAEQLRAPTEYPDNWYKGLPGNLKQGFTKTIEQEPVQAALRYLKFDGYISRQNRTSPLSYAVYNPTQLKSVTDNSGEFDREVKNISYSLRSFRKEELPQKGRDYTLPANTLLYHGAYKERADRIDEMGGILLSRPPMRVSGGAINEGGLIFFGDEDSAQQFAESRADPRAVEDARQAGIERLPGKVFETATDRSYELINRNYKMNAKEAKALTKALGLPDYKALSAGLPLETAAYRALEYDNSKIDRYEVTKRTGQGKEKISAPWPVIFRTLGVDGFYDSLGVALTANNGIKLVGKDGKLEKYSLPKIPAAMTDRVNEISPKRIEKGFARRMVEAIAPKSAAHFRAESVNRYNQMSLYDKERAKKMGGAALLADQSAESAALMSDVYAGVVASAMGTDNRSGGIPVLRNGITTIDRSVKGLVASLSPLASYGDPVVYQRYQFWAMVKRSKRLMAQGKNTGITSKDIAFADYLQEKHPEFVDVQKDLINFNNGLVKYMIDTGVLSKERGAEYVKYADYVPFYRQMEGEKTIGPNLFSSISNVRPPKKLKGLQQGDDIADAPLADFLETMVRNTTAAIQAGAKNYAAQRTVNVVTQVKAPGMGATRLDKVSNAPDTFNVLENGEVVSYQTPDELLLYAVKSLNATEIPGMNFFSMPANLLRNLVTRDPGFIIANLMRDSLSAYVTSGQKMTPMLDTVIGFGKALGNMSPTTRALLDAGIISGYDAGNIEESGRGLEKDLAKKAGKRKDAIIFRPFTSLWDGLEKATIASDAATRAVIYDRVLAETGNEAEALYRALEVMNFHRKGGNTLVRFLTAAIPFFNARLQGLDLFYRASSGNMNSKDAAAIQRKFFMRGSAMMALSVAYYLSVADDEEYKKQEQETKDNNWLFPALGIRIPIPFEVGVLFKVIPERITALLSGRDSAEDFGDSALRNLTSTFGFNPIPQTFKPFFEAYVDYNFFTGRPIISEGLKDVAPEFQVGPGTTVTAEWIAGVLGASPMKVDHIIKGFTGTIGGYALDTIDAVSAQFSDTPRASKRFEQLPVIKRFVSDPEARGSVTEFYKLKESVDTVVRTLNLLEKTNESEAYIKYLQENMGTYAFKDYIRDTERTMKELRGARVAIRASAMSADEKRDALTEISRAESEITMEIKTIKKAIASMQ